MKKTTIIKIVELDNKSRKGSYIYIHEPGSKKSTYYNYNPEYPLDYYLDYYKQEGTKGKKKPTIKKVLRTYQAINTGEIKTLKKPDKKTITKAKNYMRKLKKQYGGKRLEAHLQKGITSISINDLFNTNPRTIQIANEKLLSAIILDKNIRKTFATEENMQKIKNRLEQRITIIGQKGETLSEFNTIGKTTTEVTSDIQKIFTKNEEWKKTGTNNKIKTIEALGYNKPQNQAEGNINRIQLITIFRKAK